MPIRFGIGRLFHLAIDSKLQGCELVILRLRDVSHGNQILPRAMVVQRKAPRPVQFALTDPTAQLWQPGSSTRGASRSRICFPAGSPGCLKSEHGSTPGSSTRRWPPPDATAAPTAPTPCAARRQRINQRTRHLRAVQLLLGHTKRESTVRCLGIDVDAAVDFSESTGIARSAARARPVLVQKGDDEPPTGACLARCEGSQHSPAYGRNKRLTQWCEQ
jgi:hypothetical protein